MSVGKCLQLSSCIDFIDSFLFSFTYKLIFEFLLALPLDISVNLSESLVWLNTIFSWSINNQSTVVIVALIKIPANDPFEDSLELVIVDRKSFCLIHSPNFSKINFKQKIKVMSLNKIWNCIRQDTVKKFISIDQLLRLTNAIRTVLGTNRQKIDHS